MSTNSRRERVRRLFQAALDQPAERRDAFVSSGCDGDAELRREVSSLLSAHAAAGEFLDTPAIRLERSTISPSSALEPGDRLGHFEVIALLGAGGMGEVYRAHDSQLGRDVALKLLPPAFAADPERLARFERESRILASLNHPNIAAIHSIEDVSGLRLLVLELVEGPTLADRLKHGPLAIAEALAIARQLADALEAAHERGIVHRDLKPANVKLAPSGRVMLLDFGLAKERVGFDSVHLAPSDAVACTTAGLILGTCAYMSPEQARGTPVDKRADIWAFGCILFELLSGQRTFRGDTPSDTIAAVLEHQPDWQVLPAELPMGLRALLRRCLEKDAHRRLHDVADARLEIDDALQSAAETSGQRSARTRIGTLAAVLAGVALVALGVWRLGWWVEGASPASAVPTTRRCGRSRPVFV
jgi:eukaryotic-like serine/threonine-protein kinase